MSKALETSLMIMVDAACRAPRPDLDLIAHLTATPMPKTAKAAKPGKKVLDQARKVFEGLKAKMWSTGEEERPGLFKFIAMNDSGSFWRALRAAGIPAKTDPYNNLVMVGAKAKTIVAEIQQVLIKQGRPELAKSVATILAAEMTPEIMRVKIPTTEKMDSGDLRLLASMCLAALEKYRPAGSMEKAVHQKVVFKPF